MDFKLYVTSVILAPILFGLYAFIIFTITNFIQNKIGKFNGFYKVLNSMFYFTLVGVTSMILALYTSYYVFKDLK